jgi:signal recognition particle subunit SEC65
MGRKWLQGPQLQRPLPDGSLQIVVRGARKIDPRDPTVEAQEDSFSFGIPSRSAASPSARKPPIFQEIRLAIRSNAAKQPIGARWENSRCRRMVKAAAARMTAQRIKPAARVAGIATRIAADISNPPVTRHHHAGYPHRTKLLRVVDVAIALNRPALVKAAASSQMNIMCMAQATANA